MNKIMPNRSFSPRTFMGDHGISIDYNYNLEKSIVAPKPWKPSHSRSTSANCTKFVEESLFEEAGNEIQTIILHSFNIYDDSVDSNNNNNNNNNTNVQQITTTTTQIQPQPIKPNATKSKPLVSFLSNNNNNRINSNNSNNNNNNNNSSIQNTCKVNNNNNNKTVVDSNSNNNSKIAINVDSLSNLRNIDAIDNKTTTENISLNISNCKLEINTNNNNNNNNPQYTIMKTPLPPSPTIASTPSQPTIFKPTAIVLTAATQQQSFASFSESAETVENKASTSSPSYNGNGRGSNSSSSSSLFESFRSNSRNDSFLLSQTIDTIIENYTGTDSLDMKIPFFSHVNSYSYSPCFSGTEPLTPPTRTHNPITMNQAFTESDLFQQGAELGLLSISPPPLLSISKHFKSTSTTRLF